MVKSERVLSQLPWMIVQTRLDKNYYYDGFGLENTDKNSAILFYDAESASKIVNIVLKGHDVVMREVKTYV